MSNTIFRALILLVSLPLCLFSQTAVNSISVCKDRRLHFAEGRGGVAGGSFITGIVIKNISTSSCSLQDNFDFQQFDAKGVLMPIDVSRDTTTDMGNGPGSPTITLKPQEQTLLSIQTSDRTGYDQSRRCAVKMKISRSAASRKTPLFVYRTISCNSNVIVFEFHQGN